MTLSRRSTTTPPTTVPSPTSSSPTFSSTLTPQIRALLERMKTLIDAAQMVTTGRNPSAWLRKAQALRADLAQELQR